MFVGLVIGIAVGAAFSKLWIKLYGMAKAFAAEHVSK